MSLIQMLILRKRHVKNGLFFLNAHCETSQMKGRLGNQCPNEILGPQLSYKLNTLSVITRFIGDPSCHFVGFSTIQFI